MPLEVTHLLDAFSVAQRLSATGSFVSDLQLDEHAWSAELYRIFELDPHTVPTRQAMRDLVHPDDLDLYDSVIAHGMADNDVDFEFRIVTARAGVKYLHCAALVSRQIAERPVFMGAIRDMTESRLVEEELRRAHDHLAEAQRLSKTGSFTADLLKDEHIWSDELYRICEFEPGSHVTIRKMREIVHPDDMPTFDTALARGLAGTGSEFMFRIVTSNGVVKHLRSVAHRVEQISDRPVFVGAIQDMTASKVAEHALNVARAELAHVGRVMTLGALTASIAHEVNQPLAGIITNASTCLRMLAAQPPNLQGARATAQRTIRDGTRASDVLQRLRAMFSRRQPMMELLDLNDAAREVLALTSSELQGSRVILRTEFGERLPAIRGDRVQLQQVMLNLILNATDAMKHIDDRPRSLLFATAHEDADCVSVSVRDSGVGIDPRTVERLFDAFYTTKSHGMGVGLSISRSIIESHEGRIWARANDGPGATFAFSIPCIRRPPSPLFR
jgi:signal transduction histidine kinase